MRDRVARLQRRDDALELAEALERGERVGVGHGVVLGAPGVLEERVLGADARVVEPGADRVRVDDLDFLGGFVFFCLFVVVGLLVGCLV